MAEEADSDDRLSLQALASGDMAAFDEVMRRHGAAVYRQLWKMVDTHEVLEDLTQEVFLTLWHRRRRVTIYGDSLLPWLFVTARQLAYNSNRKERRRRTMSASSESLESALRSEGEAQLAAQEELRWIDSEIAQMSPIDQKLARLCLLEGVPYDEAAGAAGVTAGAARKRIQRLRGHLRAQRASSE
jgi:RNA polymerase sigma-70 factor (ECF subfamily)